MLSRVRIEASVSSSRRAASIAVALATTAGDAPSARAWPGDLPPTPAWSCGRAAWSCGRRSASCTSPNGAADACPLALGPPAPPPAWPPKSISRPLSVIRRARRLLESDAERSTAAAWFEPSSTRPSHVKRISPGEMPLAAASDPECTSTTRTPAPRRSVLMSSISNAARRSCAGVDGSCKS